MKKEMRNLLQVAFMLLLLALPGFILASLPMAMAQQAGEATSLDYNIEFNIIKNKVVATHTINFLKSTDTELVVELPEDVNSLDAYVNGKKIEPVILASQIEKTKKAKIILIQAREVKIEFVTSEFLEISKKQYFLADFKLPIGAEKLRIRLVLPEYSILDKPGAASVSPEPSSISTDGQKIAIEWSKYNAKKDDDISLFVVFREKTSIQVIITAAVILAIALALIAIIKFGRGKRENPSYLIDNEKTILNALKNSRGELWQKQIQLASGFSKAKLSRIIRNLETRGLISRTPVGNTNKIKLK